MAFKAKTFEQAKLVARTATLTDELNDLADWFDGEVSWTVRGLTYDEIARAEEAERGARENLVTALAEVVSDPKDKSRVNELREALGFGAGTMPQTAKAIEILVLGSVDPPMTRMMSAKLSRAHPVEFTLLVRRIMTLTGQGQEAEKKSQPSGQTPACAPA